jgi:pimeloyl-ACP methyl ester carboxylesterase
VAAARRPARARLPVVLLPGFDGSGRLFAPLLAAGPRGIAPRVLPLPSTGPQDYQGLRDFVLERLPRRGRYALLAESFSGPLAAMVAAARPRGLERLVLAATFLRRPLQPWLAPAGALAREALFRLPLLPATVRLLLAGADAPAAVVEAVREVMAVLPPRTAAARATVALGVDAREALAATRLPLLVLAPGHDRLLRRDHADDMLVARPDARVAVLPAPHMILQRAPQACLALVEGFLREAPVSTSGGAARRRGRLTD